MLQATATSKYLNSLRDASADAMSNLYYVEFFEEDPSSPLRLKEANLTIRNQDFNIPTFAQETHTVNYMTASLDLPSPSWSGEKILKFNFRVDNNYELYKALRDWRNLTSDPYSAYASMVIPGENNAKSKGITINVYALALPINEESDLKPMTGNAAAFGTQDKELLYSFGNCWVRNISGLSYTYDSADPVKVSVEIAFSSFNEKKGVTADRQ